MTITSTIRCDLCGKSEPYPLDDGLRVRPAGSDGSWFPFVPDPNGPTRHCCSVDCWVCQRDHPAKEARR